MVLYVCPNDELESGKSSEAYCDTFTHEQLGYSSEILAPEVAEETCDDCGVQLVQFESDESSFTA